MSEKRTSRKSFSGAALALTMLAVLPPILIYGYLRVNEQTSEQTDTCKVEDSYLRDIKEVVSRLNVRTRTTHIIETSDCGDIYNYNQILIGFRPSLPWEETCIIARGDTITVTTFLPVDRNTRAIAQIHSIQKPENKAYSWKSACP